MPGQAGRWCGQLQMPGDGGIRHMLILRQDGAYRAVPAHCPHEGYRLDACPVNATGQLVCAAHGLTIGVEAEYGALPVERRGEDFVLPLESGLVAGGAVGGTLTVLQLQDELDALRQANAALESQVLAVSEQMEEMVEMLSAKGRALEQRGAEAQRLSAFVTRVLDTMDNLLLVLDRFGRIQQVNAVAHRVLGYAPGELEGASPDRLLPADTLAALGGEQRGAPPGTALFRAILRHGQLELEANLVGQGADRVQPRFLLRGSPLFDATGKLEGMVVVGSDVTRLRQREVALMESEQRFRDFSGVASDWFWEMGPDLRFLESEWEFLGTIPTALTVGRTRRELATPEDRTDDAKWLAHERMLADRREFRDFEYRIPGSDGSTCWVNVSGRPVYGPDGAFRGYRGTAKDISARKAIEAEIRQHRDHLSDLVAARTADLVQAKEAAERASQLKTEFLSNISHELRTPLHGILSFATLGRRRLGSVPADKIAEYLSRIHESGERLSNLVNDLLDLAKLEAGRMAMNRLPTDLAQLCQGVRQSLDALCAARGIKLAIRAECADSSANVDGNRLRQVVTNIYSNAIKFSPDGGQIRVTLRDDTLTDAAGTLVPALAVEVDDEGPGIPEAEQEAVFDKFVQSSKTKTGAGGTGLGLAICREIVHAHGGTIAAGASPLGGARFLFRLPRG